MLNKSLIYFWALRLFSGVCTLAACNAETANETDQARLAMAVTGQAAALQIRVSGGLVEGTLVGATREFFGIPYAKPPLGQLRFAPAQPHAPWDDVLDA